MDDSKAELFSKEVARRLNYIILRDGEQFPVESNSYDLIYSFHVGEHLRAPRQVLAETHRVLKPGGLCIHTIDLHDHIRATEMIIGSTSYIMKLPPGS